MKRVSRVSPSGHDNPGLELSDAASSKVRMQILYLSAETNKLSNVFLQLHSVITGLVFFFFNYFLVVLSDNPATYWFLYLCNVSLSGTFC